MRSSDREVEACSRHTMSGEGYFHMPSSIRHTLAGTSFTER